MKPENQKDKTISNLMTFITKEAVDEAYKMLDLSSDEKRLRFLEGQILPYGQNLEENKWQISISTTTQAMERQNG